MHPSSYQHMLKLVETYIAAFPDLTIIDIGSYDVNGTYRPLFDRPGWKYIGVDLSQGKNVDVVLDSPYQFPFHSGYADCIISGQAFEHIEFFWLTWNEMVRVLKPGGFIFLIAPSCGWEHRYPVDCWRFYPDGFRALAKYSDIELLDVHTDLNLPGSAFGDTVGVFRKQDNRRAGQETPGSGSVSPGASGNYLWEKILNSAGREFSAYHQEVNHSLIELIQVPPRLLLDIGCASGSMGEHIKSKYPDVYVVGVESNPAAAQIASSRLDKVVTANIEKLDLASAGIVPGSVDTVILGDVLEHLYDPWHTLQKIRPCLTPDAQIIASIPNMRNLTVFQSLSSGSWEYQPDGLFDITHLRFFMLKDIVNLFRQTGYQIVQVSVNLDERWAEFYEQNKNNMPLNINIGRITINNVTADELKELCALRFSVAAKPAGLSIPSP